MVTSCKSCYQLVQNHYESFCETWGDDTIVKVYESKFGNHRCYCGQRVEGVWILGMVESTPERRIKLIAVRIELELPCEIR